MKSYSRFLILWLGQLISSIGNGLTAFALGIFAYRETGSATSYSIIMFLAFLPSFLLRPLGGVLSDLTDRRLLMIIGDLGSAGGLAFILFMMLAGFDNMWVIYLGVTISSVFVALQNPAFKASITDLVPEEKYAQASGLTQLAESSKFLFSPIIAGFLYSIWNIKQILVLDIMTYLVAIVAVFVIKKSSEIAHEERKVWSTLVEGFKYTLSHKGLFWLLFITSLITFFIGFLQALLGPMILSFTNAQTLGVIQSLSASGMLISSALIGAFNKSGNHLKPLAIALACSGVFFACLGIFTDAIPLIIFGFCFFFTLPFINTNLDVLIRKNVNNEIQGRVWSIVSLISQTGMVIALGIAGPLADTTFNPLLMPDGALFSSVGLLIGTGEGRGIGLMFILAGICVSCLSICIKVAKSIRELEE